MRTPRLRTLAKTTVLVCCGLVTAATPAAAHVTTTPSKGPAGGFATIEFQVGHGCEDAPTTELAVRIPAGVASVAPEVEPGWALSAKEGTLPEPVSSHGERITEGVLQVTWKAQGQPLDPHYLTRFGMSLQLPEGRPGDIVYFPTIQRCAQGATRWIQIPSGTEGPDDLDRPAPAVTLTEADGHGTTEEEQDAGGVMSEDPGLTEQQMRAIVTESTSSESGSDPMNTIALILGVLGVLAGGTALLRSRRSP